MKQEFQHPVSGVVIVDKPADISSAGAVRVVKSAFKAQKAGHAGTLDPFATGVLVCCINRATRLADFFLKSEKIYRAVMDLGVATDTQDATGKVISRCDPVPVSPDDLKRTAAKFTGRIRQLPPVFSALKHRGVPLYKLARKGQPVQKPPRSVHIKRLDIIGVDWPSVRFEVECSAGTYVRSLCADMGAELGCGGHLRELRRVQSSGFTLAEAVTLSEIEAMARTGRIAERIIGMAEALKDMPGCTADTALVEKITRGQILTAGDLAMLPTDMPAGFFKIVDGSNRLVAVVDRKKDLKTYDYRCVFPN